LPIPAWAWLGQGRLLAGTRTGDAHLRRWDGESRRGRMSSLAVAFDAYIKLAGARLRPTPSKPRAKVSVIANPLTRLREGVGQLEGEARFNDLIAATREAFRERDSKATHTSVRQHAVRNFFRRSGFYLSASRSRRLDLARWLTEYETAFNRQEEEITYLAPMELVRFTN
jgi:hypothetical protein